MFGFKSVTGKFKGMRKENKWTVCPVSNAAEHERYIQSSTRIARVNLETGTAVVSKYRSGGAYFIHLSEALGAQTVECPQNIIDQLKAFDEENGGKAVAFLITGNGGKYLNQEEKEELEA